MEDNYQGTKTLLSFSPRWADPGLLESTLVGRRELVDRLEELAVDGAGGPNKHQRLIVGVRGSGKTHVLRVLHNRLWSNEELKKRLVIVYLLEDELGVASFLDFVVRLLRAIVQWCPEEQELARELEGLCDLPLGTQENRAVQLLLKAAGSRDVLIILENLGVMFDRIRGFGRRGQQALRDLVQRHPRFMMFASAQALVEGISDTNAPFYGFFKVIHLRALTLEDAITFLRSIASAYGQDDLVELLDSPRGRGQVHAIYHFTAGNHRLLVTYYDFLCADSVAKLSELFMKALNPLKPFYQEQMRSLSAQQQKIVQYLSVQRTPRSVKEIARGCLATSSTVSSQLADLLRRNFVARIQQGRESYYEIAETLFRICYEADLERDGAPVRLFVDFLANFYTAQELQLRQRGFQILAEKMGSTGAIPYADEARFYSHALALCQAGTTPAMETTPGPEKESGDRIRSFFHELETHSAYREVIEFARHLGEDRDAFVLHTEAHAYAQLGKTERAVASAEKALEKDPTDVEAHLLLAGIDRRGDPESALAHAERACELAPNDPRALVAHASVLASMGRLPEAEGLYRKSLELDPVNVVARKVLGALLGGAGRYAEALEHLQQVNRVRPDDSEGWMLAALALWWLDRLQEAEALYRKALALDPANADVLGQYGGLLGDAGRHSEALEQFRALNKARPDDAEGWRRTATTLGNLGRLQEAEALYRKALQLDPTDSWARRGLGILLNNSSRYAEALEQFEALNQAKPNDSDTLGFIATALRNLGRLQEAEAAFRRALELDPANASARRFLGILLNDSSRYSEALEQFRILEQARPNDSDALGLSAIALHNLGRLQEAEARYRKALDLDPANAWARKILGILLSGNSRYAEALEQFEALTEAKPDDADALRLRAKALRNLGRLQEAVALYRKASQLDPKNVEAWAEISTTLASLGDSAEADRALDEAVRLGANRAELLNSRGEFRRMRGEYNAAIIDYQEAIRVDPQHLLPRFNSVSALVALGKIDEALAALARAIEVDKESSSPKPDLVAYGIHENCMALFRHGAPISFGRYLTGALDIVERADYLAVFDKSVPLTVFALLKNHANVSNDVFEQVLRVFEEVVGRRTDVSVALRFLRVGVDYLKNGDRKALLTLPREERLMLCRELGIDDPSS